jgi:guanine deaminase
MIARSSVTAIRGAALTFAGDPFLAPMADCLRHEADAVIIMTDGEISAFGPAERILPDLPEGVAVTTYADSLILPGFIDCHVHYPQTEIIGAHGADLIDWLNRFTFIAEQNFADKTHASEAARIFLREALRCGTTSAAVFCTIDPVSVDAFFEEAAELNMRTIAGKVLMDRNAPDALLETAQQGYDRTKELIARWHNRGRSLYAVTPRFAPTSTPEQMEMTGAVWAEHPGTYLQSHVSETLDEVAWVKELYPDCRGYVDVYDRYGQLGPRAILGHGIHLTEDEFQTLHDTGTALAHCPTSNLFLGSGLFSLEKAKDRKRSVRTGMASDLGAGTSFSPLVTLNEAHKVARMTGYGLSAAHAFYLATRGAAEALYLVDRIGSIAVGMEADLAVLDLKATPLLENRLACARDLEECLAILMTLGDDRANRATYVAGKLVYARDTESRTETFAAALSDG